MAITFDPLASPLLPFGVPTDDATFQLASEANIAATSANLLDASVLNEDEEEDGPIGARLPLDEISLSSEATALFDQLTDSVPPRTISAVEFENFRNATADSILANTDKIAALFSLNGFSFGAGVNAAVAIAGRARTADGFTDFGSELGRFVSGVGSFISRNVTSTSFGSDLGSSVSSIGPGAVSRLPLDA